MVSLRKGWKFLSAQPNVLGKDFQKDPTINLYFEIDTEAETDNRYFAAFATGADLPEGAEYLGSYVNAHIYEVKNDMLANIFGETDLKQKGK